MKKKTPILLALAAASLLVGSLTAQDRPAEDPFRKNPNAKPKANDLPHNIVTVFEHILVPSDFLSQWELQNEGQDITHEIARQWVANKKGTVDHSAMLTLLSGQKTTNETTLELIHPTQYQEQGANSWPLPTAFETRNLGYSCEMEAVTDQNKLRISSRSVNTFTEFIDSKSHHLLTEKTKQPGDMFIPNIKSEGPSSNLTLTDGKTLLVGKSGAVGKDKMTRLVFQRSESVPLIPSAKKATPPNIHLQFHSVIVESSHWNNWTMKKNNAELSRDSWQWAKTLIGNKEAKIHFSGGLKTPSGQRGSIQKIKELTYPTKFTPVKKDGKTLPAATIETALVRTAFETRNIGSQIEVEPTMDNTGQVIDLRISIEFTQSFGERIYHRVKDGDKWVPDLKLPVFATMRQLTGLTLTPHKTTLIGVTAAIGKDGMPDPDKRILHFIKAK